MTTKTELEMQVTELQAKVKELEDSSVKYVQSQVVHEPSELINEIEALKSEYSKLIENSLAALEQKDSELKNLSKNVDSLLELLERGNQQTGDLVVLGGKQCVIIHQDTVIEVVDAWRKKNIYDNDIAVVVRKQ